MIGPDGHRDLCRQAIIVTITNFIRRHSIILIDYRHHAVAQQLRQSGARIQIAAAIRAVFQSHQDLRCDHPMRSQMLLIGPGQLNLPHGGRCLALL